MGQDQDYGGRPDLGLREENQECPQIESATKSLSWGEEVRNQASREVRLDFFLLRKYGAENTDRLWKDGQNSRKSNISAN